MQKSTTAGALLLAALIGCQSGDRKESAKDEPSDSLGAADASSELQVEVFYRERMLLPPSAELEVTLENSAKMDTAAEKIAQVTIPIEGGPPYRVAFQYDSSVERSSR